MSSQGDDCYFYFYSTCNKGDSCSFRHCEAALGSETVCTLWQEGRCFRNVCRFRHMEIDKKRSEIACYWENQPGGCQKHNCAFHHAKGRYVDGLFLPPSKTSLPGPAEAAEEEAKLLQLQQNKLCVQPSPSAPLRGLLKAEGSESVPSPTHPPLVINAADDDEDDDDQLSEEGEDSKAPVQPPATEAHNGLRVISTRKPNPGAQPDDNLNFGIKTLEEIKLKKLKEKAKKQGEGPSGVAVDPLQARSIPVPEKENVRTVLRTVTLSSKEGEDPVIQLNLPDRLGKRKTLLGGKSFLPLRRNVADRLGRKAELQENSEKAPKRGTVQVLKSLKERLGLPSEQSSTETDKAAKPIEEIRVKTLEEIRLERAHQRRGEPPAKIPGEGRKAEDPNPGAKPSPAARSKSLSGALAEKNHKRSGEEKEKPEELSSRARSEAEPRKQSSPAAAGAGRVQPEAGRARGAGEVRIKTLEEIKREKALRLQQSGENIPAAPGGAPAEAALRGRKLLRVTRLLAPGREEKMIVELNKPSPKNGSAPAENSGNSGIQVKSLEEIMWEKRQQKQRQEEKLQQGAGAIPAENQEKTQDKNQEKGPGSGSPEAAVGPAQAGRRRGGKAAEDGAGTPEKEPGKKGAQLPERRGRAKSKVCLKPLDAKAPPKQPLKRKGPEGPPPAVVAVKPLSATSGDTQEPPAKVVPPSPEDSPGSNPRRENSQSSPELQPGSQGHSLAHSEGSASSSSSSSSLEAPLKLRRLSSAGAKAALSVEDDFEKLIWEISGGKLEAEIDLDPGKDEDDLLLELSEMIDS
ncbi:LOW QUALITY PROTEIN: zinc finger CCCH domain-containing protein 11A [Passer domesticus]|uniref:LOW QUALITY PROTEIN: zinc finger CCCH domain-containing protein 11A n=1 Tax=Passer domesticus TaxID=48849 RepID=UPI0030FEFBFD